MPSVIPSPLLLLGDIGGTHLSLALGHLGSRGLEVRFQQGRSSRDASNLIHPVRAFLAEARAQGVEAPPAAACFAGAGPVRGGRIQLTNLPWSLDQAELAAELGVPVAVINDGSALVQAVLRLDPTKDPRVAAVPVAEGPLPAPAPGGLALVVGAGTGLGVGFGFLERDRAWVFPSEGGHLGLPIFDEASAALHAHLARTCPGPPGAELVVSGPGLARLLAFESTRGPLTPAASAILGLPEAERPKAIVAQATTDPACAGVVDRFIATYARVCADLVSAFLPVGGLYLAGGVTARLAASLLGSPRFREAFTRNYRPHLDQLTAGTPVYLLRDYALSLEGAAWAARDLLREDAS